MLPISIYLDSSDFSKFSELEKHPPEYRDVLAYLMSKRDEGLIVMCFSEAHALEAAPTSPNAVPAALNRFRIIKELCGKNCLMHPLDLWKKELSSCNSQRSPVSQVIRSDGAWMPASFDLSDILPDVDQMTINLIKQFSRADRRKYLKNGRPTPKAHAEIYRCYTGNAAGIAKGLPLTIEAAHVIERYYRREGSRDAALAAMQEAFGDMEAFGCWYAEHWETASNFLRHLREEGAKFKSKMVEARDRIEQMQRTASEADLDTKKIAAHLANEFKQALARGIDSISNGIATGGGVRPEPLDDPWKTAPGTTCSITLWFHVFRRTVLATQGRASSHSDMPDIYQTMYLPYVDIYRADSFMASALQDCKLPFPTAVADKVLQLPDRIEKALAERTQHS